MNENLTLLAVINRHLETLLMGGSFRRYFDFAQYKNLIRDFEQYPFACAYTLNWLPAFNSDMKSLLIGITLCTTLFLISCDPDPEDDNTLTDPCSLQEIEGKEFSGSTGYCNAIPGHQFDFGSIATVTGTEDTVLVIRVFDTIPNFEFDKTFVCTSNCWEGEPNHFHHDLFMEPGHKNVGHISSNNRSLIINIKKTPCENSIYFSGHLKYW